MRADLEAIEPGGVHASVAIFFWVKAQRRHAALAHTDHRVAVLARRRRDDLDALAYAGDQRCADKARLNRQRLVFSNDHVTVRSAEKRWLPKALRRTVTSSRPKVCWPGAGLSSSRAQ